LEKNTLGPLGVKWNSLHIIIVKLINIWYPRILVKFLIITQTASNELPTLLSFKFYSNVSKFLLQKINK
jgi:hypothetical protein